MGHPGHDPPLPALDGHARAGNTRLESCFLAEKTSKPDQSRSQQKETGWFGHAGGGCKVRELEVVHSHFVAARIWHTLEVESHVSRGWGEIHRHRLPVEQELTHTRKRYARKNLGSSRSPGRKSNLQLIGGRKL